MKLLKNQDIINAGEKFNISPAIIEAFRKVESAGSGFYFSEGPHQGELKVLFEGHYFYKFTQGKFFKTHPTLCYPKWTRAYYLPGQQEFGRFMNAYNLCTTEIEKRAALQSTSWGLFQIMGANYKICGYNSVEEMVESFYESELNQLEAVLMFLINTVHKGFDKDLLELLQEYDKTKDKKLIEAVVEKYNGSGQVPKYTAMFLKELKAAAKIFK